jgi:ABC-type uncharacterized transport system involved in gliding motility auxiliary subunit
MRFRNEFLAYGGLALLLAAALIRLVVLEAGMLSLLLAVGGVLIFVAFFFREGRGIQEFLGRRSTREGSGVLTTSLLVVGSVILVNILADHYRVSVDVTRDRLYTLSPETAEVLRALPIPAEVWVFLPENSPDWSKMQVLVEAAREASPELVAHFIDPAREPLEAMRFGLQDYTSIVQVGERREPFRAATERAFLEALVRASHPQRARIAVLVGHGESYMASTGTSGLSSATGILQERGYPVEGLDLVREGEVPDSVDVVIVAGPASDPSPEEEQALLRFLGRGGRLLLLLDPARSARFATLLPELGLSFVPEFLVDPESQDPQVLRTPFLSAHPAVEGVRASRLPVVFPGAGWIERTRPGLGVTHEVLVRSGRAARTEGEEEGSGARGLVVAAERQERGGKESRVVVAADADFPTNRMFGTLGNADLFLGLVHWLGEENVSVSIPPRTATSRPVVLSRQQGRALMVLLVGLLPLGVLGAGTVVWWKRR